MLENEKKVMGLNEEELKDVAGGWVSPWYYNATFTKCPSCGMEFGEEVHADFFCPSCGRRCGAPV